MVEWKCVLSLRARTLRVQFIQISIIHKEMRKTRTIRVSDRVKSVTTSAGFSSKSVITQTFLFTKIYIHTQKTKIMTATNVQKKAKLAPTKTEKIQKLLRRLYSKRDPHRKKRYIQMRTDIACLSRLF